MDAELKAKWVEALRSGKYEQGRGSLFNQERNRYCCLGVLCVVKGVPPEVPDGETGFAPIALGLDSKEQAQCVELNDGDIQTDTRSRSFAEIADYIEANL